MRNVLLIILIGAICWAGPAFGTWKMNAARSTFAGDAQPRSFILRIEPHAKGEVFTVDRIEADGRATTASTILYLDGKPRDFQDSGCSGSQSSRRVDSQTVEILHTCTSGGSIRFLRRFSARRNELVLEVTERQAGGRRVERRLVLERRSTASR
jgi:hypothetical protein